MAGGGDQGGLSRRDMLKRGAVVAGGAWVAPLIIESIISPAYAVGTPAAGTSYQFVVNVTNSNGAPTITASGTAPANTTCLPSGWSGNSTGGPTEAANVGFSVTGDKNSTVTGTIRAAKPCQITAAKMLCDTNTTCSTSTGAPSRSVSMSACTGSGVKNKEAYFIVTCS